MDSYIELFRLEVKEGDRDYYLGATVVFAILFIFEIAFPFTGYHRFYLLHIKINTQAEAIILFAMTYVCAYSYYKSQREITLRIDREGIWTKKYKTINWKDISYFQTTTHKKRRFTIRSGNPIVYTIVLQLNDTAERIEKEISIDLTYPDKKFEEMRNALTFFASRQKIPDMGHEKFD